ncbi:hypothetical protein JHK87_031065 [Glycine soja]|nr:hypothetical protein JHK87_031065 [Glycine soja]
MIQLHKNGVLFQLVRVAQLFSSPTTPFTTFQFTDKNLYDLLQNKSCEAFFNNYTLPFPHSFDFASFHFKYNTALFRCNRSLHVSPPTSMYHYTKCPDYDLYYNNITTPEDASLTTYTKVLLPIKDVSDANNPFTFVTTDILTKVELTDECAACHYRRGGQCQLDSREIFCCSNATLQQNLETSSEYFGVPLFLYEQLKEATNKFDHIKELSDRGLGTVYHARILKHYSIS